MVKTGLLLVAITLAAAGCTAGGAAVPAAPQDPISTTAATSTTSTTTTAATTPTTTVPSVATALETEPHRIVLDRSEEATVARMLADATVILDFGPREAGGDAETATADWLTRSLRAQGLAVTIEPVPLPNGEESRNVIVTIGSGPSHVLIGAHMDTITGSPGLDDNGSGVIIVLEVARRLAESPAPAAVTLVFFGAEETLDGYSSDDHHFGSRQMAQRLADEGGLPDAMVSVDMVGRGERLLSVTYRNTDPATADDLARIAADLGSDAVRQARGDISDHEGFARRGVPSAMLWRPDNPDYHTASDDSVRIDAMLEVLAIVEAFIWEQ